MKQAFFKLHLSILLAGFTGIFGKLITLNTGLLVWYRMCLTTVILLAALWIAGQLPKLSGRDIARTAGAGTLLALHWVFFYGSIRASNVSIGVVCFSLVGFFTAVLEPLVARRPVSVRELLFSLITVSGIALIFHFDTRYRTGILLGIVSSAMAALFTIANKRVGAGHPAASTLLWEMAGGLLCISCLLPLFVHDLPAESLLPGRTDVIYLLLFTLFCTIGLYVLQIQVLQSVSAFTVNLSYNLEPVYSILLAVLIFGEARELSPAFYTGIGLIMLSVVLQTFHALRERQPAVP